MDLSPRRPADRPPLEKPSPSIQDYFLNTARKEKIHVTIYLISGVKLTGRIKSFDRYSLVLETNNQEQLIFKHAISTVVAQKARLAHAAHAASSPGQAQPESPPQSTEV